MIFHTILYSKYQLSFEGSSIMPLFFLLSGFSLTITYRSQSAQRVADIEVESVIVPWLITADSSKSETSVKLDQVVKSNDVTNIDIWSFYRNRIARVIPTYYLGLLFALPLRLSGFGSNTQNDVVSTIVCAIVSFLPLCTVFMFFLGDCLDGPGWTICTLAIMWMMFPWSYRGVSKFTDEQLVSRIVVAYWVQVVLVIAIFFVMILTGLGFWPAFAASTMQPFFRYPLFLMGVYAGELSFRNLNAPSIPWPKSFLCLYPSCRCIAAAREEHQQGGHSLLPDGPGSDVAYWSRVATSQAACLLILTLSVALVGIIVRHLGHSDGIFGEVWLQAIVPFAQLDLLVALTRDQGQSLASKVLRTPAAQWLGKLSMAIYLLHFPVIFYLCWATYGKPSLAWPTEFNCDHYPHGPNDDMTKYRECIGAIIVWADARSIELWGIVAVPAITIPLAALVFYGFEEPLRRTLRSKGG
jgi:peptidoglycan/LPS O-acetylase OafA/YrhL